MSIPSVHTAVVWLWNNFILLMQIVGAVSILNRVLDQGAEAAVQKWPNIKFFRTLDRAFDSIDAPLGWLTNILSKLALNRTRTPS